MLPMSNAYCCYVLSSKICSMNIKKQNIKKKQIKRKGKKKEFQFIWKHCKIEICNKYSCTLDSHVVFVINTINMENK